MNKSIMTAIALTTFTAFSVLGQSSYKTNLLIQRYLLPQNIIEQWMLTKYYYVPTLQHTDMLAGKLWFDKADSCYCSQIEVKPNLQSQFLMPKWTEQLNGHYFNAADSAKLYRSWVSINSFSPLLSTSDKHIYVIVWNKYETHSKGLYQYYQDTTAIKPTFFEGPPYYYNAVATRSKAYHFFRLTGFKTEYLGKYLDPELSVTSILDSFSITEKGLQDYGDGLLLLGARSPATPNFNPRLGKDISQNCVRRPLDLSKLQGSLTRREAIELVKLQKKRVKKAKKRPSMRRNR
jgi:hypothetical protein